jgi:MFS family permease
LTLAHDFQPFPFISLFDITILPQIGEIFQSHFGDPATLPVSIIAQMFYFDQYQLLVFALLLAQQEATQKQGCAWHTKVEKAFSKSHLFTYGTCVLCMMTTPRLFDILTECDYQAQEESYPHMTTAQKRPTGMAAFTIVWIGQVFSLLGTAMSQFALTLWAYEITGKATPLALVSFFFLVPMVALGPFVGVLVDRGNRKLMMMFSDLAAAFTTAIVLVLSATDKLQVWHLYVTATITGVFQGFQWPAYSATIALMLPKKQYARANGMLEMAGNASGIFAPILAGALIGPLGLTGILIIDLISAAIAIGTLIFVYIPQPPKTEASRRGAGSFLKETAYGFRYILSRPSLLGLQTVFMVGNFFENVAFGVLAPMILARTGNSELIFGSVQSAGAIGGLVGGLVVAAWGGPKRRVHGVLVSWFCIGLLGTTLIGIGQTLPIWAASMFLRMLFSPIVNSSNQAIWQAKVTPAVQGRVFATRATIAWLVMPLGRLLSGPLADQILEPAMAEGGSLSPAFSWLVGTGTGAGMGLQFAITGLLAALTGLSGYLITAVRNAEDILPDYDSATKET